MCSAQTVVVFVEVHHLEAVELSRHLLDLFGLIVGNGFDTLGGPTIGGY